ncbi:hypothetical protein D3C73_1434690 [compost metagenome]
MIPAAVTHVSGDLEPVAQGLAEAAVGAVPFQGRQQIGPQTVCLEVFRSRGEIRRPLGHAAGVGADGELGDIGSADEAHDIAGRTVESAMIRSAERPQVPIGRIGPVQAAETIHGLIFIGEIGRAA